MNKEVAEIKNKVIDRFIVLTKKYISYAKEKPNYLNQTIARSNLAKADEVERQLVILFGVDPEEINKIVEEVEASYRNQKDKAEQKA